MPLQLIYTSAPSGLVPGRSGFCTVARHRELTERLVVAIEKTGIYEPPPEHARAPIFSYRIILAGGETFGILTRCCDAGLDYTSRRNYLAHHFIFTAGEMAALPPPAELARRFSEKSKWISQWDATPRFLDDATDLSAEFLKHETRLPAATWQKISGDAGNAATLCPSGIPAESAILRTGLDDETLLKLIAESSLLVRAGAWSAAWTTCIQKTDTPAQFPWRGTAGADAKIFPEKLGPPAAVTPTTRHAHTGVPPEKQPKAGTIPVFAARTDAQLPRNLSAEPVAPAAGNAGKKINSLKYIIILLAAVAAGAACLALWQIFKNKTAAPADDAPTTPTVAHTPPPPTHETANATVAGEMLRQELQAAVSACDWIKASALWQKLSADAPTIATKHRNDLLPLIQAALAGAFAKKIDAEFTALAPKFSAAGIGKLKKNLAAALATLSEFNANLSPETGAQFAKIQKQIELLEILPEKPPALVFANWRPVTDSPGKQCFIFRERDLSAFLNKAQGEIKMRIAPVTAWDFEKTKNPAAEQTLVIPPKNFTRAKALYITPVAAGAPSIYFENDRGRIFVTHAPPATPTSLDELFAGKSNFRLSFAGTGTRRQRAAEVSMLFLAPSSPPRPLRSSLALLDCDKTGRVAIPDWLNNAIKRFGDVNPVLYPEKAAQFRNSSTDAFATREGILNLARPQNVRLSTEIAALQKQISNLEIRRQTAADITQIDASLTDLRTRLDVAGKRRETLAREIAELEKQPAATFMKQSAPWIIGLRDNDAGEVVPLIILE